MTLKVTHTKTLIAPDSGSEDKVYGSDYVAANSHTITGGEVIYAAAPNTDFDLTAGGAGTAVTILSTSLAGVAIGDQLLIDPWYSILNNSGTNRNYTPTISFGTFTIFNAGVIQSVASATTRSIFHSPLLVAVSATNLAYGMTAGTGANGSTAATIAASGANNSAQGWNSTTSDMTGTNTFSLAFTSSSTTTTQTLTLHGIIIRKISAT